MQCFKDVALKGCSLFESDESSSVLFSFLRVTVGLIKRIHGDQFLRVLCNSCVSFCLLQLLQVFI